MTSRENDLLFPTRNIGRRCPSLAFTFGANEVSTGYLAITWMWTVCRFKFSFVWSKILLTEIHAQKCKSLNPRMKISWNPQEVSCTTRTKNSSRTNKQGQTWNLCRRITAREVFCCCIFGGTLRQKWTSILTGLLRSCVVCPAQVHWTTACRRAHIGKVCTTVTIWDRHHALFHRRNKNCRA